MGSQNQLNDILAGATFLWDITLDLLKEACKEAIVEEIEAVANQVRQALKPIAETVLGLVWEVAFPIYSAIPLKIKATIALLLIVAMIINHAVSVGKPSRRG